MEKQNETLDYPRIDIILIEMKKQVGIIETLKAATTVKQVNELAKKLETYNQVSAKTVRKFTKISKKKRAEIKKKS